MLFEFVACYLMREYFEMCVSDSSCMLGICVLAFVEKEW